MYPHLSKNSQKLENVIQKGGKFLKLLNELRTIVSLIYWGSKKKTSIEYFDS